MDSHRKPVDRRLGYSLRRTDIHMTAATEKGISHGATATLISARPSPRHRPGPRRSQRTGAVRGSMGAPRSIQALAHPDYVRYSDSARPREATGRPPATCARQRAQTKRTERSHYPSGVLRRLASGDDCRARRQAGVRRPLATARRGRSAPYRLRSSWRGTPRTQWPEQLADGPLTLQYSPSSRTSRRGRVVPRAVVSRCSNVKPKLLDYWAHAPRFADTAAFDATLVNLGFGPQLRPQQVRPPRRAVSSVPALPLWSRQAAFAEELARSPTIAHAATKQLDR